MLKNVQKSKIYLKKYSTVDANHLKFSGRIGFLFHIISHFRQNSLFLKINWLPSVTTLFEHWILIIQRKINCRAVCRIFCIYTLSHMLQHRICMNTSTGAREGYLVPAVLPSSSFWTPFEKMTGYYIYPR